MKYSPRYRLLPTTEQRDAMDWTRDTTRQLYNHALHEYNRIPEDEGTVRQRVWEIRDTIPELKEWWTDLTKIYSTVLQKAVERVRTNIDNLGKLKATATTLVHCGGKHHTTTGVSPTGNRASNSTRRVAQTTAVSSA